jgi:hypothetical protein
MGKFKEMDLLRQEREDFFWGDEQQAPWVGLTDEYILAANYPDGEENGATIAAPDVELIAFARAIEAKLKEKNRG